MKTRSLFSFILIKKQTIPFTFHLFPLLFLVNFWLISCSNNETIPPTPQPNEPKITSGEFKDDLLFVNSGNFQIQTSESATFSSTDPKIQISSTGLIKRITSAEVVAIDVNWVNQPQIKTRIYALGATDSSFDEPYVSFHGRNATNAPIAYQQGWQTLQKLPVTGETYAIILRHADADQGKDFSVTTGPPNWWTSCDSTLARQNNLQGIQRATDLGKIFKDLQLPITRVISSEFCRSISTAQLINAGPTIVIDGRLNHNSHNVSGFTQFEAMITIMNAQPVDNNMTLIVSHHPINEINKYTSYSNFPVVSPFSWNGAYFIKIAPDKTITYEGAASWGMFKYWRDKKLKML